MTEFHRPLLMGVLNATPDSFSDGGKFDSLESAVDHAKLMAAAGASVIDVGGESTRPGAARVSPEEEQARVIAIIERIAVDPGARISIDTMNASTAKAALEAGASIINDVSGGLADPQMFAVAADTGAEIVISHWRAPSDRMDEQATYDDVAQDVAAELRERVLVAEAAGIAREKIVIDPGLGFSKDMQQNWQLIARLDELEKLGLPILVGASRKRFLAGALDDDLAKVGNDRRDIATAVLTALLLQRKLWGVRVHNVLASADAIDIVQALRVAEQAKSEQS